MTPAIGVPASLVGLFNFRGAIVPAVAIPSVDDSTGRHAIVVRIPTFGRLAVLCDWVEDLRTASDESDIDGDMVRELEIDQLCEAIVQGSVQTHKDVPQARSPRIRVILKNVVT